MLQTIRDKVQGWIAGTIVTILALTFALWGIESYLSRGNNNNGVAKVNGNLITTQQLDTAYQRLRNNLISQNPAAAAIAPAEQGKLRQQALQQLINAEVLSKAAVDAGFRISPAQLDDVIMQMPAFQDNGRFSPERFARVLEALSYNQNQFVAELEKSLLVTQVQMGIMDSEFALPREAKAAEMLLEQKRDFTYAIIPAASFKNKVTITPADINTYYQQHQDQFKTTEAVSLDYIELSAEQLAKNLQPTDSQLQQFYQDNISNFTRNGKTQPFAEVKGEIEKNWKLQQTQQQFSDQNQKLSELTYTNPTTLQPAASALNLTVQSTNSFTQNGEEKGIAANPQVLAAAFSEDVIKNGNNSNVIALKDGDVVVVRVKQYQPAKVRPLSEVKSQIQEILQQQATQAAAQNEGQKIITALEQGNKAPGNLQWKVEKGVSREALGINTALLKTGFALPYQANTGKPAVGGVALANGDYAIVIVKNVQSGSGDIAPQQLSVAEGAIRNNYAQVIYQLYVNDLMQKAKIKMLNS